MMFEWRATAEERREVFPGDELIPEARRGATHAITICATAADIWPWLLQMGCDRAGWYSYDRLDNGGNPSADCIVPEYQDTAVGDILASSPGSPNGFEVLRMEPEGVLLLGAYMRMPGSVSIPWNADRPSRFVRATWVFLLREQDGATRLLVRVRGTIQPWWLSLVINLVSSGPVHTVMQRKQLLNLRCRTESGQATRDTV